ncbi:MAG: flavodoxin family protein [Prevotellaceae bacterium]|jgi:multimeric flavodoxin WrbA|nr:flavodoxin family protein [Prevotellaceae bacterium]
MGKKILALSASARKNGNSSMLCDEFLRGAKDAGHETEKIFLCDKKINGCLGCFTCQKNGGECIQNDDMSGLYEKMRATDVVVFASPVYFYSFNAQMKTVLDRTIALHETFCDKTAYLIAAGQAPEEKYMTTMIDGFRKYIGCFPNIREGGIVFGYGVSDVGDVKGNPAMEQAYEMGKNAG